MSRFSQAESRCAQFDKALHVWDLRSIRDHLAEMHLEGDWPSYPPATPGR